jgi:hypothetical protein
MMTRAQIIQILEGELNAIEDRDTEDNAQIHHVLKVLIVNLKAVEAGDEAPALFIPTKVKAKGKRPATLRKCRLIAIGAVSALRKAGYKVENAIDIVADAYGLSPDAIRQWRKTLGKDTDPEAQILMQSLPSSFSLFALTKDDLLNAVKRAGQSFKDAQGKKGN